MRRRRRGLNPTLRGFLIIAGIVLVVVTLQLYTTLMAISMLLRIAFFLAIAFFIFLLWRDRMRYEIETWSRRSKAVFYGAVALIVLDLGVFFWPGRTTAGLDAVAFVAVLALAGFSMWRIWRDERTLSY